MQLPTKSGGPQNPLNLNKIHQLRDFIIIRLSDKHDKTSEVSHKIVHQNTIILLYEGYYKINKKLLQRILTILTI